ncbi:outer membrane protein [Gemmobacter aquatilis]|uniref:Outer membrane protein n=1 Tax=Gemmobacter aquatilis TaxID=933059 RepID=A0A1H8GY19_9RHOB|nr:OmpW family outer membrane protein [Gemmobacter aquatilis]SEN48856.1 outer membrane protein [Gemmobacter aquatilis]
MKTSSLALVLLAATAAPALAQSAGDMTFGFGIGYVAPTSDNGTLAGADTDIGDSVRPTITFEYFVRDNIGIEVLGALPFHHSIDLGGDRVGSTKQLPPTVSVNYHIPTSGPITPFVGVGVNYTTFFEESSSLGDLSIDDSWGLAAHLGMDYALSDTGALRMDLRYIDINSDVYLDGAKIGKVDVNPLVAGISYIMKF